MTEFARRVNSIAATLPKHWRGGVLLSCAWLALFSFGAVGALAAEVADQSATVDLAARIAHASFNDDRNAKLALQAGYEKVYGSIDNVPSRWPALVRRTLVCQQLANRVCVRSSLDALQKQGGIDGLQLSHMFEVSRFGMTVTNIKERLLDAVQDAEPAKVSGSRGGAAAPATPAAAVAAPAAAASIPAPAPASPVPVPYVTTAGPAAATGQAPAATAPAPAVPQPAPATTVATPRKPRSLTQRAVARLNKLNSDEQSGFFLDALFGAVAVCLILLFLLYLGRRARKAEQKGRLQALQEIQRLENLQAEEKIKTDHELWSEQLKSEVAVEAQKAHAEEVLRTVKAAADEALNAEMLRFQMENEEAQQVFKAELQRLADALRAEQAKTDDMVKAAKARADQAIDAYDQMAARELVYAHQQNDDLQDALKAEQQSRSTLEARVADALQQVENYKQRELRLNEALAQEQRGRAAEARIATEKLKAAQQAAVALQASLAATRALNADLERRAEEALRQSKHGAANETHGSPANEAQRSAP